MGEVNKKLKLVIQSCGRKSRINILVRGKEVSSKKQVEKVA